MVFLFRPGKIAGVWAKQLVYWGTIFLDEVDEESFSRINGEAVLTSDVSLVAATNSDLKAIL